MCRSHLKNSPPQKLFPIPHCPLPRPIPTHCSKYVHLKPTECNTVSSPRNPTQCIGVLRVILEKETFFIGGPACDTIFCELMFDPPPPFCVCPHRVKIYEVVLSQTV